MSDFFTKTFITVALSIIMFGFFGYKIITATPGSISSGSSPTADVITLVDQLKAISFDGSFFTTPLFTSLHDLSAPSVSDIQGRANPFAAIGTDTISPIDSSFTLSTSTKRQ